MKRREFIALVGGGAAMWPLGAWSQQHPMPVIGFMNGTSPQGYARFVSAFLQGLRTTGFVDGRNVAIEYRWAEGHYERLEGLAADLVGRKVALIVATSTPANVIAMKATAVIPIVFTTASDPVQLGLVASLSRPGGNVTGATQLNVEVGPKRLELAHELAPTATLVALLVNPNNPSAETLTKNIQGAALDLGLQLHVLRASTESEIEDAFTDFLQRRASVLVIGTDAFFKAGPNNWLHWRSAIRCQRSISMVSSPRAAAY